MITITGALDYFMDIANVPDYFVIMAGESERTPIDGFLETCDYVEEYEVRDTYVITDEVIEILSCAAYPEGCRYNRGNTVMLEPVPENLKDVTLQCR